MSGRPTDAGKSQASRGGTARGSPTAALTPTPGVLARELDATQRAILRLIASGTPLAETLDALLRSVERQSDGLLASILLLDPDGLHVRHGAAPSLPEEYVRALDGEPIGPRAGSCGTAAWRREPVIVEDIATDPLWADYREAALGFGLRACWSTPIFDPERRVLATFAMYYREPRRPDVQELAITMLVADLTTVAITRERSKQELARLSTTAAVDRAESAATLRESEKRLRLALDAARMGTFEWDLSNNRLVWSRWHKEAWGYGPGEFSGSYEGFADRVHPEDLPGVTAAVARCIDERGRFFKEFRVVWPDGSVHWVEASGEFEFDTEGPPLYMRGVALETTARHRAEQAIRESELKMRLFVEHSPAAIAMFDGDMRYLLASRRWLDDYRIADQEVIGRSHYDIFPDLPERWKEIHRRCLEGAVERCDRDPFPRDDGRVDWVRWEIRPWHHGGNGSGGIGGVIIFSEVITAQVEADLRLREREDQLKVIYDTIEDVVFYLAIEPGDGYRFKTVNRAFLQITGLSGAAVVGHTVDEIVSEPTLSMVKANYRRAIDQRTIIRWEETSRYPTGELTGAVAIAPLFDNAGVATHLVGSVHDITERKRAEDELRALNLDLERRVAERTAKLAAQNRELETFTYSVSHDLKAPLRGLDGYSRLLLEDHADRLDDEGRQFLHTIRRAAAQMSQLIDDLLAYSRLERRQAEAGLVNLRSLVDSLLAERADEVTARKIALHVDVPELVVSADAEGLALAIRNLLGNALKFTRDTLEPSLEIELSESPERIVLSVRDNGVGFDMQFHDRIFEIFQRLHPDEKYGGTGIGLAIVRRAMERMGGRAWAESEPGRGATFFLELPR